MWGEVRSVPANPRGTREVADRPTKGCDRAAGFRGGLGDKVLKRSKVEVVGPPTTVASVENAGPGLAERMFGTIAKGSVFRQVSESVADQIQQMISDGAWKSGDRLPSQSVLAKRFGVGHSSMREALLVLETRGLVKVVRSVGVFVGGNSKALKAHVSDVLMLDGCTVPELFEIRYALESEAVALAAKRIVPDQAARLREILERFTNEGLSDAEHAELDALLHKQFVIATGNGLFLRIYDIIQPLFVAYSARIVGVPGRRESAYRGHVEMVEAVINGGSRAAQMAVKKHLKEAEHDLSLLSSREDN